MQILQNFQTVSGTRGRGRTTVDTNEPLWGGYTWIVPTNDIDWQLSSFEETALEFQSADRLIKILTDASPDVDRAHHDFLRYCNPGWILESDDPAAQTILDEFVLRMSDQGESLDAKIERLSSGAFLSGAFFLELVFDERGYEAIDLVVIDPFLAAYRRQEDPVRGQYYQLGQVIDGRFVELTDPTIKYEPINPVPNNPFGRSLISSAIFPCVFLLGLLKSARQVVETQAWPRSLISVDRQILKETGVPPHDIKKYTEQIISQIKTEWPTLKKTEVPVYGSEVKIEGPVGAMGRNNLDGLNMLERVLERWIIRALKTQPILFGSNEALTESHADVQLLNHTIFIKSIQSSLEKILTRFFTLVLRARGNSSIPVFRLKRVNAIERRREAEIFRIEMEAASIALENGFYTAEELREHFEGLRE